MNIPTAATGGELPLIGFMADHAPEGIVIADRAGRFRYVNHMAESILGIPREMIYAQPVFEIHPDFNRQKIEEIWDRIRQEKLITLEVVQIRQEMRSITAEVTVHHLPYPGEEFLVAFFRDISDRKEQEYINQLGVSIFNSIHRSVSLTQMILNIRDELGRIIDTSGLMITLRNRKTGQYNAFYFRNGSVVAEKIEVAGTPTGILFDTGTPLLLKSPDIHRLQEEGRLQASSSPAMCWLGIPLIDGEEVTGVISVQHFEDESAFSDHHLRTMEYVASQITSSIQRKQSEEALKESEKNLRESNISKDKFFSIIAHDLRGPFNAIIGFSELLNTELDSFNEMERRTMIRNIHDASVSTFKLLENLLEWSRIQTGRTRPNPENVDISTIVNTSLTFLKPMAEKKKIKLFSGIHFGTIAFCDENMITTVIRNLISNAIKFTNPLGDIRIWATEKEKVIEVVIADNGVGIPPENQAKLFRLDESVKTRGTSGEVGTGLGLILCREFIELNGGRIWVESVPDKGSQFKFTLQKFTFETTSDGSFRKSSAGPEKNREANEIR